MHEVTSAIGRMTEMFADERRLARNFGIAAAQHVAGVFSFSALMIALSALLSGLREIGIIAGVVCLALGGWATIGSIWIKRKSEDDSNR